MRFCSISLTSRIALTTAGFVFALGVCPLKAQTETSTPTSQAVASNTTATTAAAEPGSSTMGNVASPESALPAQTNGKGWHDTAVPTDKQINAKVVDGTLTVDGLVAKVRLNYDIQHANYMYFYVPGVGTAIVSRVEMYGATKVKLAFNGSRLEFSTGGHTFELSSRSPLMGSKSDAYVVFDSSTVALDRFPMVGFGSTTQAPYVWPLSGMSPKDTQAHFVAPPPLPSSVLPRTANTQQPAILQQQQ